MRRTAKISQLLDKVHRSLDTGCFLYMSHALERMRQREVSHWEVLQALKAGHHEKRKDKFAEEFGGWNYSIQGKTKDNRNLRIAVSFDEYNMLVITVIDLDLKEK